MTKIAPVLRPPSSEAGYDSRIWPWYEVWRQHFERCAVCNAQEWYDPEVARLCGQGQRHYRRWVQAAAAPYHGQAA